MQQGFGFKKMCEASDEKLRQHLNKNEPVFGIKSEMDNYFEPETVLVTDFHMDYNMSDNDFDYESSNIHDRLDCKPEPREDNDSANKSEVKIRRDIKVEEVPSDCDENTLVEYAQIVDGRYQCKFCDKTLADRRTYRLHIRLHTGKNLKRCNICDRGFAKQSHLDSHLKTHAKDSKCSKTVSTGDKEHKELCTKVTRVQGG